MLKFKSKKKNSKRSHLNKPDFRNFIWYAEWRRKQRENMLALRKDKAAVTH